MVELPLMTKVACVTIQGIQIERSGISLKHIVTAVSEDSQCSFNNNDTVHHKPRPGPVLRNTCISLADARQSSQQGATETTPKEKQGCGRLVIGSTQREKYAHAVRTMVTD